MKETTAYDYGYNYGSYLLSVGELSEDSTRIIDLTQRPLPDIPVEDYREMREFGIFPSLIEYWKGFNWALVGDE